MGGQSVITFIDHTTQERVQENNPLTTGRKFGKVEKTSPRKNRSLNGKISVQKTTPRELGPADRSHPVQGYHL